MAIKLKYFLIGEVGGVNKQTGRIDVRGVFDAVTSPIFPMVIPKMLFFAAFEKVDKKTSIEFRINSPSDKLMGKLELEIQPVPTGMTGKHTLQLEKFPVQERGKYTVDILEKKEQGYKFIKTCDMFTATYPPKRIFQKGEVSAILEKDDVIKSVKTDYAVPGTDKSYKFQINLDPSREFDEGYEKFPEDDKLVVEDKVFDLTGVRRQLSWMFGKPLPKQAEAKQEEQATEEIAEVAADENNEIVN